MQPLMPIGTLAAPTPFETTDPGATGPPNPLPGAGTGYIPVRVLNRKHACFKEHLDLWTDLHFLYQGGDFIRKNASRFLRPRPKEPRDLLAARLERFTYENVISTIMGWYTAKLFREQPQIEISAPGGSAIDPRSKQYFADLMRNCNGGGKPLLEELQGIFIDAALYKTAWTVVDRPNTSKAQSYAEQLENGFDNPKVLRVDPLMVYNWSEDADGNLEWVVIAMRSVMGNWWEAPVEKDIWYVFDRTNYWTWVAGVASDQLLPDDKAVAFLADSGQHAMAAHQQVPVRRFELPHAYWLGSRLYLPALTHLNSLNELNWALMLGCLSQIVIASDDDLKLARSESTYIKIGKEDKLTTTEPQGTTFRIQRENIDSTREEMFRASHLMHMGRSSSATPALLSGEAKQADMTPSAEVLEGIGAMLRTFLANLFQDIGLVRMKPVVVNIVGYDFAKDVTSGELDATQAVLDMGIPSELAKKELWKQAALRQLPQISREKRQAIVEQIDSAKPAAEQQAAEDALRAEQLASAISKQVVHLGNYKGDLEDITDQKQPAA